MSGYQIPNRVPDTLVAGNTWSWATSSSDYSPADGWSVTYYLRSNGQTTITATSTTSGTGFLTTILASVTASIAPGDWYFTATAAKGLEAYQCDKGRFTVEANPATSAADPRSAVKRTLDAITKCIEGSASKDELAMTVDSVSLSNRSLDELSRLRSRYAMLYKAEVNTERASRGLPGPGVTFIKFNQPN